jgi:FSR family fosmidomycin resistance protein-like MFS transporter
MAPSSEARNERNVILLTGVGHFSTHFLELMFPTVAVYLAADTGVPLGKVLSWSFFGYLLFGIGALPAGLLGDRIGSRLMLIAGMAGMGVFAIAAGEATSGTALTICLAGIGLFASFYHPVGMSLITRVVSARGRALGINGIFGNLAIAVTPIITAVLCETVGWQHAYSVAGYLLCAIAAFCAFFPIDEPPLQHALSEPPALNGRLLLFAVLLVAATLGGISYRGNTLVQPAYFAERVSTFGFGAITSIVYLVGIGGQYLGGRLADRHDLRWLYFFFHAITLPALLAMTVLEGTPLIGAAMLFVFFSLGMQPIENSLVAHVTPARWRATAYGIKFVFTFGVGALGVLLVEWAQNEGGLSFAIACLAGVVALLLTVIGGLIAISSGRGFHNHPVSAALRAGHTTAGRQPASTG